MSAKQEAFAVAVAKGASVTDAYRQAYAARKMAPKTIHEAGSRLAGAVRW